MSGGSHNYVDRNMRDGPLFERESELRYLDTSLRAHIEQPVTELRNEAYARAPMTSQWGKDVPYMRPATDQEREDVARYGMVAMAALKRLYATMDEVVRQAADLADIARVIDLAGSGDRSTSCVHQVLLEWGRRVTR